MRCSRQHAKAGAPAGCPSLRGVPPAALQISVSKRAISEWNRPAFRKSSAVSAAARCSGLRTRPISADGRGRPAFSEITNGGRRGRSGVVEAHPAAGWPARPRSSCLGQMPSPPPGGASLVFRPSPDRRPGPAKTRDENSQHPRPVKPGDTAASHDNPPRAGEGVSSVLPESGVVLWATGP